VGYVRGNQGDVVETEEWAKESGGLRRTSWAEEVLKAILFLEKKGDAIWQTSWIRSMSAGKGSNCKARLA
jgi:hypothetical protein